MWSVVVDRRDPFADDRLKFVDEEECLGFRVRTAGVDIGTLVALQGLQEVQAQRQEEAFQRTLVAASSKPCWLNRDAQSLTHTREV